MRASVVSFVVSAAAAAVRTAHAADDRLQRAVLAHTVCEGSEDGPAAALERARRKYVSARSEDEQDDENPKTFVAAKTAIHSVSSYTRKRAFDGRAPQSVCKVKVSAALCYIVCRRAGWCSFAAAMLSGARKGAVGGNFCKCRSISCKNGRRYGIIKKGNSYGGTVRLRLYPLRELAIHFFYGYPYGIRWRSI